MLDKPEMIRTDLNVSPVHQASAAEPAWSPGLDVTKGMAMMGSEAALRTILAAVVDSMASDLPGIAAALAKDDVACANRMLHAIKGYLPILATDALVDQVTRVEATSKTESAAVVRPLWADLAPRLDALLTEIRCVVARA